jgi:hypothetical protein
VTSCVNNSNAEALMHSGQMQAVRERRVRLNCEFMMTSFPQQKQAGSSGRCSEQAKSGSHFQQMRRTFPILTETRRFGAGRRTNPTVQ